MPRRRPDPAGGDRRHRDDAPFWLAVAAAAVTVVLTGTAFWLSYQHLSEVAAAHSLRGAKVRSWAWPATVDLFIVVGELLILRASLLGRLDWWAVGLTVAGSGGSVVLNVAGVGADAGPLDYLVAAIPPLAALLAFGALMRQLHEHLTAPAADTPPDTDVPAESPAPDTETTIDPTSYTNPAEAVIRPLYDQFGTRPTTAQMRTAMAAAGIRPAASTARDARRRIEQREPHLAPRPELAPRRQARPVRELPPGSTPQPQPHDFSS